MLVAWRERVKPDGEAVDDQPDEEDRRLLTLIPLSRCFSVRREGGPPRPKKLAGGPLSPGFMVR